MLTVLAIPLVLGYFVPPQPLMSSVEVTGFAAPTPSLPVGAFLLARLIVTCHAAHAQVGGLIVLAEDLGQMTADQWVEVQGTLALGTFDGHETLFLMADEIVFVPQPRDPYIWYLY